MIVCRELTVNYGMGNVLQNFSFEFPERGTVCLSGPSGCGKSTLLNVLAGLVKPRGGSLTGLEGKRISVVFQSDRLLPWRSAAENLACVREDLPLSQAQELLTRLGFEKEDTAKFPHELSGGMRRRVAIGRALHYGGDVLLLDEPFTGLDRPLAGKIARLIRERMADGLTVLVSHDSADPALFDSEAVCFSGPPLKAK